MRDKNTKSKIRSMTAFGRASIDSPQGHFEVEIQSVNRRYLEMNFYLPGSLSRFESEMRKWTSAKVGRGQVNVNLQWKSLSKQKLKVVPNIEFAKALKKAYETIAEEIGIKSEVTLSMLAGQKELLNYDEIAQDDRGLLISLEEVMKNALSQFVLMRESEGDALGLDFLHRIGLLSSILKEIEGESLQTVEKYREKLNLRLKDLFEKEIEDERILKEVALFAEKADITEEIIRFKSHINEFVKTLEKGFEVENETKGKKLEFIIQELLREMNTIGSKSLSASLAKLVLQAKCELEKMKEQVQNIE